MSGFVDEAQLNVRGGDGGAGAISFRREAHVPRGGPDGGDGGSGGDIWLQADRNVASLLAFRDHPHRRATSGTHGQGKKRHGRRGDDLVIAVPEGTTVRDRSGAPLADLAHHGDRWMAAHGGQGGKGNTRFLTNFRRAPSFGEQGEEGEEQWLSLELKLLADVALVGFPNVGKSTLISRLSAAKPKIADYPFTTLEPNLGVVRIDNETEYVVADIPGLIEGASEGRGLGHQFLRHVERARVLVLLIDLAPMVERPPAEQEAVLIDELGRYEPALLDRPRLVIGSRADLAQADQLAGNGDAGDADRPAVPAWAGELTVSAVTGQGLRELAGRMADEVRAARATEPVGEGFVVYRPAPEGISIERIDERNVRVCGRAAERAVAISDLTNHDALAYVQGRLRRLGVDRALVRAGVGEGDTVHIGGFSFDYELDT